MGHSFKAKCKSCGFKFKVEIGGGFTFHLLHCDACGKSKAMSFDEIGEPNLRYKKGLPGPYSVATSEFDKHVRENYPGEPLSEEEYHSIVEDMAGSCKCGGKYKFDAPPRCPKCKSDEFEDTKEDFVCYD
jgi:predicted Zn-ribbon and HTH transcriptional regulator